MFFQNKYTIWYYNIINNALQRIVPSCEYHETHHIIPKCMGGTDEKTNLVNLTANEHYICHLLLTKMSDNVGLKYAFHNMCHCSNSHQHRTYKINSRIYAYAKRLNATLARNRMIGISYNKGKKLYHNPITKEMKLFHEYDNIPDNFIKGGTIEKRNIGTKNKGKKYFYHPKTRHVIAICSSEQPPNEYIPGNCNANTIKHTRMDEREYYFNSEGKEKRFFKTDVIPEGWTKGRCIVWITDGYNNKQINSIVDVIPEGWTKGRTQAKGQHHRLKPIQTPLGKFDHPYRFCAQYNCNISFFDNLNSKIRKTAANKFLVEELEKINYNFNMSKRDNGFYFIDYPDCTNQYLIPNNK